MFKGILDIGHHLLGVSQPQSWQATAPFQFPQLSALSEIHRLVKFTVISNLLSICKFLMSLSFPQFNHLLPSNYCLLVFSVRFNILLYCTHTCKCFYHICGCMFLSYLVIFWKIFINWKKVHDLESLCSTRFSGFDQCWFML